MTQPKVISVAMLKKAGACNGYLAIYAEIFGPKREIPMSRTLARIIAEALHKAFWVADHVMTPSARTAFHSRADVVPQDALDRARQFTTILFETYQPRKFRS